MIDELKSLQSARPPVSAPDPAVRRAALAQLQAAIAAEGARAPRVADGGGGGHEHHALRPRDRTIADDVPGQPTGRRGALRPRDRGAVVAVGLALITAVVIGGGAIVLLGHARHQPSRPTAAPAVRGEILDRTGTVLARTTMTTSVAINRSELPAATAARAAVFGRLASMLGLGTRLQQCHHASGRVMQMTSIACRVAGAPGPDTRPVVIRLSIRIAVADAIRRDAERLPGVVVMSRQVRTYPAHLAAQALGAAPSAGLAGLEPSLGVTAHGGLERFYNQQLAAGDTVKLQLDARLQRVGESSLARSLSINHGTGGAFVAMNPTTGAVYAMGSLPTYDQNTLAGRHLSTAELRRLVGTGSGDPMLNRAIQSTGPIGSAFTPITATAALQAGAWSPGELYDDVGQFCIGGAGSGGQQCRHNAGHVIRGPLDVTSALKLSDSDFFYNLGALTNPDPYIHPNGGALDDWAYAFGIGRATGVDLPNESTGTLPDPTWRQTRNRLEAECDSATGPFTGQRKRPAGGCGIADGTNRPWSVGDNINLAVGQGDLQTSPLQLAVAYAAIANGGTIVRPHLAADIQTQSGDVLQTVNPPASRHLSLNPTDLQAVRAGLHAAATQRGGASSSVFGDLHFPVYGQTGTAQYITVHTGALRTTGWFAGYVPTTATGKPIVVVVSVENGGYGDIAAAPVARQILSQWIDHTPGPYRPGASTNL